jgi:hypothetical protein
MIMFKSIGIFLVCITMGFTQTLVKPAGSGTPQDPYQIDSLPNLAWISASDSAWGSSFVQTSNIEATSTATWDSVGGEPQGFKPIGQNTWFNGNYDGNHYEIRNLFIHRASTDFQGLFGRVQGYVKNLKLINVNITGKEQVGALAGYSVRPVEYVEVSGSVTGTDYVGGIIGYQSSSISRSINHARVMGQEYVGGISGWGAIIIQCSNTATIVGDSAVGGISGLIFADQYVMEVENHGDSVIGVSYVGGILGIGRSLKNAINHSHVVGQFKVGGIIGTFFNGAVVNAISTGSVIGISQTGGAIGYSRNSDILGVYWNSEASSNLDGIGDAIPSAILPGYTIATLQQRSLYSTFDFIGESVIGLDDIWIYESNQIPTLSWQNPTIQHSHKPQGSGTATNPYLIASLENLFWLSKSDSIWNDSLIFSQTIDIDASVTQNWNIHGADTLGFTPIGSFSSPFKGHYRGNGHVIENLYVKSNSNGAGLFGFVKDATIDSVGLINLWLQGKNSTGGIAGRCDWGNFNQVFVSGTLLGVEYVGGLVGYDNRCDITNSYSTGSVEGISRVGGLIGQAGDSFSSLENVYSSAIATSADTLVGGLIGYNNQAVVQNAYWDISSAARAMGHGVVHKVLLVLILHKCRIKSLLILILQITTMTG